MPGESYNPKKTYFENSSKDEATHFNPKKDWEKVLEQNDTNSATPFAVCSSNEILKYLNRLKEEGNNAASLPQEQLYQFTDAQWDALFKGLIENKFTSLNLASNELYKLTPSQWKFFFLLQNSDINSLDLSDNDLSKLNKQAWVIFISGLAKNNVTELYLNGNQLCNLTKGHWDDIFLSVKVSGIKTLHLSNNQLNNFTESQWRNFFTSILENNIDLNHVNITIDELSQLTQEQKYYFKKVAEELGIYEQVENLLTLAIDHQIDQLSSSFLQNKQNNESYYTDFNEDQVNILDLENNVKKFTPEYWDTLFSKLNSSGDTSLNLSFHSLSALSEDQWLTFFTKLKESPVRHLDLSGNRFYSFTAQQWLFFFSNLKNTAVTSLNLSFNFLSLFSKDQWLAFFEGLKDSNITMLDLSSNELSYLTPEQWLLFFLGLSESGVEAVNLNQNQLNTLTEEQWKRFFEGLATTNIKRVNFDIRELCELTPTQRSAFKKAYLASGIKNLKILNDASSELQSILINDLFEQHDEEEPLLESIIAEYPSNNVEQDKDKTHSNSSDSDEELKDNFDFNMNWGSILNLDNYEKDIPNDSEKSNENNPNPILSALNKGKIDNAWWDFIAEIENINTNVLYLNSQDLHTLTKMQWKIFFDAFKDSPIVHLSLASNALNRMTKEQWGGFFEGLEELKDSNLKILDLNQNGLHKIKKSYWNILLKGFKNNNIDRIRILDVDEFRQLHQENKHSFKFFKKALFKNNICSSATILFDKSKQDLDISHRWMWDYTESSERPIFSSIKNKLQSVHTRENNDENNDQALPLRL